MGWYICLRSKPEMTAKQRVTSSTRTCGAWAGPRTSGMYVLTLINGSTVTPLTCSGARGFEEKWQFGAAYHDLDRRFKELEVFKATIEEERKQLLKQKPAKPKVTCSCVRDCNFISHGRGYVG